MRLIATVRRSTGKVRHEIGHSVDDQFMITSMPQPSRVEIVNQDEGVFLLRLDQNGEVLTDTWHETIQAAKDQAKFEFDVRDSDWADWSD